MGHTVSSQRMIIDLTLNELKLFGRALRPNDQEVLQEILAMPLKKVGAISYTSSINVWSFLLLSILIEQHKEIKKLKNELDGLKI